MNTAPDTDSARMEIAERVARFCEENPGKKPIRLDLSASAQPMRGAPLAAMQAAVAQLGCKGTFPGSAKAGGEAELRHAAAKERAENGVPLEAEEVFAFPGRGEALLALMSLVAPGARVLVPVPGESLYGQAAKLAGHTVLPLTASAGSGFLPMPEAAPAADIIVLCHPSSVTGAAYGAEQLTEWVNHAKNTGALFIVDTTWAAYLPQDMPCGVLESPAARACAVELRDISSVEGFCAAPCAFVYAARELAAGERSLHSLLERRAAFSDGIAHPVSRAATALLNTLPRAATLGNREAGALGAEREPLSSWRENASLLSCALTEMGAHFLGGTPFFWVRCPIGFEGDSWGFFNALLTEAGTVCMPGAAFGESGEGWFRLTALCDKAAAEIAIKRMKQHFRFV